jgi:hypothetical protein
MSQLRIEEADRVFLTSGLDWLGIDIRDLQLSGVKQLWVWAYRPVPVAPGCGYNYGPTPSVPWRGGQCHSDNSIRFSPPSGFVLRNELEGRASDDRVWIGVDISNVPLESTEFLLLNAELLDLPGWRSDAH